MTDERTRGVLIYAIAATVLLGGAVWFVRAAPEIGVDPRVEAWQAAVEAELPDVPLQTLADTVVLDGNVPTEQSSPVGGGSYHLSMACAGTGQVRVRVSTGGRDSGRAIECSDEPTMRKLDVALADEFYIQISAEDDSAGAVFRWRLERNYTY